MNRINVGVCPACQGTQTVSPYDDAPCPVCVLPEPLGRIIAWAVFSDGGDIEQFHNETDARTAYKKACDENPLLVDFIHLSPLFTVGQP